MGVIVTGSEDAGHYLRLALKDLPRHLLRKRQVQTVFTPEKDSYDTSYVVVKTRESEEGYEINPASKYFLEIPTESSSYLFPATLTRITLATFSPASALHNISGASTLLQEVVPNGPKF
jgi:hypothetical protein